MKPILINAKEMKLEQVSLMKKEAQEIYNKVGDYPRLAIISASNDSASQNYINNKIKLGKEIGIYVEVIKYDESVTQEELKSKIQRLNNDLDVDGIILQLPIYEHLNDKELIKLIDYKKDADCFSDKRLGEMIQGKVDIMPCTPAGIIDLLNYHMVDVKGKRVTIIGRGVHVGLSLSILLTQMGAVVTTTHSQTNSLEEDIRNADIVISCVGKDRLIQPEWMKNGSVLVGVGIVIKERKQYTDYDIEDMLENSCCSLISDRISCVGISTTLRLMWNTMELCKQNIN